MAFLFGGGAARSRDPVREQQSQLRQAVRAMGREDSRSVATEKTLIAQIADAARRRDLSLCKARAVELVRLRAHRDRLRGMQRHLTSIAQQLDAVRGTQHLTLAMQQTTQLLRALNRELSPAAAQRSILEYERQSVAFATGQEVLHESMESAFEADNEADASDEALRSVLSELGIGEAAALCAVPRQQQPSAQAVPDDSDLAARLARLQEPRS